MTHDLLNRIDQRTRLAGHNRLALLLFRLGGRQLFGVNVFKVQEVLRRPELFQVPGLPTEFAGVADVRGRSVPVLDLGLAIGHPERDSHSENGPGYLVVAEFNRSVQGFLVSGVERIVNIAVEDIHPPPELGAEATYLTAVTRFQGELIQVIDVESVLADIAKVSKDVQLDPSLQLVAYDRQFQVLVVDDSRVARQQIRSVLDQLGVSATLLSDGRQALDHLLQVAASGENPADRYAMGHQLGMTVIANGVESQAQLGFLRRNDCDIFQGYLFGEPMSAESAGMALRRRYLRPESFAESRPDRTLLLLDDEENVLRSLVRLFRRDGYRILAAGNVRDAFDLLATNDVQVILSDQRMSDMSGTEFLGRVKMLYPDTVRLVLSGYTDLATVTEAINRGAIYRFLTKPWNDDELREHIRQAFRTHDELRNGRE